MNLSRETMRGQWRSSVRSLSIWSKQMIDGFPSDISSYFGGRHHTTAMHAISRIDQQRRMAWFFSNHRKVSGAVSFVLVIQSPANLRLHSREISRFANRSRRPNQNPPLATLLFECHV
jgi:hypothetical protein